MQSLLRYRAILTLILFLVGTATGMAQATKPNSLTLPEKRYRIPFIWQSDTTNGKIENHAALLIPVRLPNCPKQFYMQFDLGAPNTVFYTNKLHAISSRYPKAVPVSDPAGALAPFRFLVGKMPVSTTAIHQRELGEKGIDWNGNTVEIIGTIGGDLLENRTVLINYPAKKITLNYSIPQQQQAKLVEFTYLQRNILFPVILRGKRLTVYFDTGSSAFELLLSKETAVSMAVPGAVATQFPVQSWGRTLNATSLPTADSIEITGSKIMLNRVAYIEGASEAQISRMQQLGIGGMMGNKLFVNTALLLDTKNKKFLVVRKK